MQKIAIVRLTAMGDIIHTLASVVAFKQKNPHIKIDWFVEEKFASVIDNHSLIDRVIPINLHSLKSELTLSKISKIYKELKLHSNYDVVVDMQGLIKSAIVSRILSKRVYGLDSNSAREGIASLLYTKRCSVDCSGIAPLRFASLLSCALDTSITKDELLAALPILEHKSYSELDRYFDKKSIVIVVGASTPNKTYPKELWVELIERLDRYNILLIAGSKLEIESAKYIASNTNATLLPPCDLDRLKYIISKSNLLIGGDTGPSHMAWALRVPSLILFGATPVSMMMQTDINIALKPNYTPHPCKFDKNNRSIDTIKPELIALKAQRLLDATT